MKALPTILAAMVSLTVMTASTGHTNATVRDAWLLAYVDICPDLRDMASACSLCHGPGVPDLDPYGEELIGVTDAVGVRATDGEDSDGDGRTNVQEIQGDCTNPGDSLDVPVEESTWSEIKGLYR